MEEDCQVDNEYHRDEDYIGPIVWMVIHDRWYRISVYRAKEQLVMNYSYIVSDHGDKQSSVGIPVLTPGYEADSAMDALSFGCFDLLKLRQEDL